MTTRWAWNRAFIENGFFRGGVELARVLNHHFSGDRFSQGDDSLEWFPGAEYRRVPGQNYLVPPSVTKAKIRPADTELDALNYWHDQFGKGWTITEAEWALFSWNPRVLYRLARDEEGTYLERFEVPFTKHPKPSWPDLELWEAEWIIAEIVDTHPSGATDRLLTDSRDALLATPVNHADLGDNIHTGAGLAHMPAMAYISNRSASAGVSHPRAVMRREGSGAGHDPGELVEVWTTGETHALLEEVADRTNNLESARNVIRERLYKIRGPIFLDDAGLGAGATEDQIRARKKKALNDYYEALKPAALDKAMAEEAARVASLDTLPADLSRAKAVLAERIEAAAMRRTKEIKGAKTQQGVDLHPACDDAADALERVTQECMDGIDEVYEAADLTAAKAAFDTAVAAIEAVTPLNVPEWTSAETTITGHKVSVRAKHPDGQTIPGRVTLTRWSARDGNGDILPLSAEVSRPGNGASLLWQATIPSGTTYPVALRFSARNLCGPSTFEAEIADPSA